jgi:aspartyl-tRNA synthetase
MSFFPIKDFSGITQLVVRKGHENAHLTTLSEIPVESTIAIEGQVLVRPELSRRDEGTGQIEVQVNNFTLLNPAHRNMPFIPSDNQILVNEDLRARFRYLDLRRTALADNIRKRSQVARIIRDTLHDDGFLEVETPLLLKSTPEGAREFLVPSRVGQSTAQHDANHTPLFYALPQSPQQPKQLLICSGAVDKYFQIAKCFRDEDGRKDRQPEFTQIDLEMAFVSWGVDSNIFSSNAWRVGGHEVRVVIERLVRRIWQKVEEITLPSSFRVITYNEAMTRYGSDKPDTRIDLEIQDITPSLPIHAQASFEDLGDILEAIILRPSESCSFFRASEECNYENEKNVSRSVIADSNLLNWLCDNRSINLKLSSEEHAHLNKTLRLSSGDTIWLSRRRKIPEGGSTALGRLRTRISELAQARGDYVPHKIPHFLWVTEFPLFTRADPDKEFLACGRWSSTHHPFTAPMWQDIEAMYAGRIDQVRGQHYDLVLNGVEIGGGSVRVHDAAMQEYIFSQVLQLSDAEKSSFDHLLHALKSGAPPHGGIALGFDRLMAILCKTPTIRDVIAFPKTGAGTDPLFRSPAAINEEVLSQYGVRPTRC